MTFDTPRKRVNRVNRQFGIPDTQTATYLSRRKAAAILGIMPRTLDKLAAIHELTIRQVPGHNRKHFLRSEIEALAAKSITTEARA